MDDLGDALSEEADFFRCVQGPKHNVAAGRDSSSSESIPSMSKMLVVSSRFGCAFVALRSSISVFDLASVRKEEPVKEKARVTLPNASSAVAIELVRSDEYLVVQSQEAFGSKEWKLLMLDVRHLIRGKLSQVDFPPADRGAYRSFTTFPSSASRNDIMRNNLQNADMLAALTWDRKIELFALHSGSGTMLWSGSTGVPENQAPISAAFSVDGSMLAVGTMRGSIQFYNSRTGKEGSTIKEVESGWIPVSLGFIAKDSLLVCYKSEFQLQLHHIVWHLDNYVASTHSVLGEMFFPNPDISESESGENEVTMLCEPVNTWAICALANSISSEIKIAARRDDGTWTEWDLDEGKNATLPEPVVDFEIEPSPVGMAIDYTDMSRIASLAENEPLRNPMPRLLVLTSDGVLLSFSLVDDRPGAKCSAVSEVVPESSDRPVSAELAPTTHAAPPFKLQQPIVHASELKPPNSFAANHDVSPKGGPIFSIKTASTETTQAEPKKRDIFEGSFFQPAKNGKEFLDAFSFTNSQVDETEATAPEAMQQQISGAPITPNGSPGSEMTRTNPATQNVIVPDISMSMIAAEDDDPVEQVRSILLEMQQELMSASSIGQNTLASVQSVSEGIESNLIEAESQLSSLLESVRECFADQSATREQVNHTLQEIIENGHNFEDLSLLSTLLTDQNDSRPLPRDIVQVDKSLSKKEAEIINSLNRIEDKLDEPTDKKRIGATRQKWRSHSEVTQHIYSSLSLQSIRIKRVKALLNSFSKQIEGSSLSRNEKRVSDLGLSLSRLERLSLRASNSPFRRPEASPSRMKEEAEVNPSLETRHTHTVRQLEEKEESESSVLMAESASVLRRLAMRKGRAKILVSPLAPVSNNLSGLRRSAPTYRQPIERAIEARAALPEVVGNSNAGVVSKQFHTNQLLTDRQPHSENVRNASSNLFVNPLVNIPVVQSVLENKLEEKDVRPSNPVPLSNKHGASHPSEMSKIQVESPPPSSSPAVADLPDAQIPVVARKNDINSRRGNAIEISKPTEKPFAEVAIFPPDPSASEEPAQEVAIFPPHPSASEEPVREVAILPPDPAPEEPVQEVAILPPDPSASEESVPEVAILPQHPSASEVPVPEVASFPPDPACEEPVPEDASSSAVGEPVLEVASFPPFPDIDGEVTANAKKSISGTASGNSDQLPGTLRPTPSAESGEEKNSQGGNISSVPPLIVSSEGSGVFSTSALLPALSFAPNIQPEEQVLFRAEARTLQPAALPPTVDTQTETKLEASGASKGGSLNLEKTEVQPMSSASGVPPSESGIPSFQKRDMNDSDTSSDDDGLKESSGRSSVPAFFGNASAPPFGNITQPEKSTFGFGSTSGSFFSSQGQSRTGTTTSSMWGSSGGMQSGSLFGQSGSSLFGQPSKLGGASTEQRNISTGSPFARFDGIQSQPAAASTVMQSTSASSTTSFMNSPPTAAFGTPSKIGESSAFGTPSRLGGTSALGTTTTFGAPSAIGGRAPGNFGSLFGESQDQSAPLFGSQTGTASGFAALARSAPAFGFGSQGQSPPLFGSQTGTASGFAALAQSAPAFGFGTANAQGFGGQGGGSLFNQSGSGSSGFGAAMQSQNGFGGSQPSGFASIGNSGSAFGQAPQSESNEFKSASFRQRRA